MQSIQKIKILSPEQAIKIAAGEVVERPAHIIKELVENSIDAGATKITIFLEDAGKKSIKIIDNGFGMSLEDAKLSVVQHATSKISVLEDLETITTFGFRGEALASINAVSNLTITTKTADDTIGHTLSWNYGKFDEIKEIAHATGTTIEITNLFGNIPARQKFLKKDETELRAIITLFQAFCLDYCNVHFQLYTQGKLQYNCPAVQSAQYRIAQIFEGHLQEKSLELTKLENKICSVSGLISSPTYYRYDRNQIFIFVNTRWVKNIDLSKAIMKGYAGTLPTQKYPAAIIFITINQELIDVNIHPKKEEVKFLHPKKVESIITQSIIATLEASLQKQKTTPTIFDTNLESSSNTFSSSWQYPEKINFEQKNTESFSFEHHHKKPAPFSFLEQRQPIFSDNKNISAVLDKNNFEEQIIMPAVVSHLFKDNNQSNNDSNINDEQISLEQSDPLAHITLLGQYKLTYILYEKDNQLTFVDQHAAHERILYEDFKNNFENISTINLLFPEFITLPANDIITLAPYLTILLEHGIKTEIFSETQLIIQATPVHLKSQSLLEVIRQIIGWIHELEATEPERLHHILHEKMHTKMACSAAIKAGDKLNHEQMQELLKKLYATENRFSCPHGRPTFWVLPIDHLEKQFKRDYGKKAEQFYDFL